MPVWVGTAHAAVSDEDVALGLATRLRSARAVLSKNQKLINDETRGDKGPTSAAVLAKAKENYTKVTGVDIDSIDSTSVQGELLKAEMGAALRLLVTLGGHSLDCPIPPKATLSVSQSRAPTLAR